VRVSTVRYGSLAGSLLLVDLDRASGKPRVALAAGVHGDEPAAPWALLSLVRDGLLDARFSYRVWCCTNPSGYRRGTRTNADGADINRSFSRDGGAGRTPEALAIERANAGERFALSLDLHEDYEARGFYCYEPVIDGTAPLGSRVIRAVDDAGLPVEEIGVEFDLGYPPEASHVRALERGRVLPDVAAEVQHFDGLPYSMYLLWTGTAHRTMTLESPSTRPWDERIATHRVAAVAALSTLAERGE
jgi:murein peptide amidase A